MCILCVMVCVCMLNDKQRFRLMLECVSRVCEQEEEIRDFKNEFCLEDFKKSNKNHCSIYLIVFNLAQLPFNNLPTANYSIWIFNF